MSENPIGVEATLETLIEKTTNNTSGETTATVREELIFSTPVKCRRTFNIEEADYVVNRETEVLIEEDADDNSNPDETGSNNFVFDSTTKRRSDEEIREEVAKKHWSAQWYLDEYWAKKENPLEVIEVVVDEKPIQIYNFNKNQPLSENHINEVQLVFQKIISKFPGSLNNLTSILIDDHQVESAFGDDENYPLNGRALWASYGVIHLYPNSLRQVSFRVPGVGSNLVGVLAHEIGHFIYNKGVEMGSDWNKNFKRIKVGDLDGWILSTISSQNYQYYRNERTGEIIEGDYPEDPEECVSNYAKINPEEDFCDSLVAFIFNRELLHAVSPLKEELLVRLSSEALRPTIRARRLEYEEAKKPTTDSLGTVWYYVREPESEYLK